MKIRHIGAWACLAAVPLLLYGTSAQARYAASELSGERTYAEARSELVRELAEQKLVAAGFSADESARLVDAVLVACLDEALLESGRNSAEERGRAWRAAGARYAQALEERAIEVDPEAMEAGVSAGVLSLSGNAVTVFSSGGKVVGFNWKALLIVALPIAVVGAVLVASGSGGAALLAVAAVVGLVLVLFVEPEWLFGAG